MVVVGVSHQMGQNAGKGICLSVSGTWFMSKVEVEAAKV
jgi:hypothetical protein